MNLFKLFLLTLLFFTLHAKDEKLDPITLQLQWKHQFEFAGFYAAKEKGFYKEVGLDVSFKEYDKHKTIIEEVLQGHAQYGLSYSSIVADYLNGKPIMLLANFFKQSPLVLVTQENIKLPSDLKGKKIMGVSNGIDRITLRLMLNKFDLTLNDILAVPTNFKIDAFVTKKVDAISSFTTNELYTLNQKGIEYNIFDPTVYGAKYYDVNLFTSEDEISKHPKRVKNFTEASIKGWEYALKYQDEIIDLIVKKYNSQDKSKDALRFEAKLTEQLILPNIYKIGDIDSTRIQNIADIFIQNGFVTTKNPRNISSFIYNTNENPLKLTDREKQFLKTHPKIVLGTEKRWAPYVIVSKDGTITGFDADLLQLINKVSGANFTLEAGDWAEMLAKAKRKELDGLSTGGIHEERKSYLNFSDIYLSMRKMILTSIDNPKNIYSAQDLEGKTIAIHKSNLVDVKIAQKFKNSKIIRLDKIEDVISHVLTGKADAMFGNGSTFYLANELGLPYPRRTALLDKTLDLAFGVRKDWPEAISIINKSLQHLSKQELLSLKKKWFFDTQEKLINRFNLTQTEHEYLKSKKRLQMCIDPKWMPFEAMIEGKYRGMNADFIKIIQEKLPVPITILKTKNWNESLRSMKEKQCDLLSLVMPTHEREAYLNFSEPYIEAPLVIVSKTDKKSVIDIKLLEDVSIAVIKDYALVDIIKENYPNLKFIEVDSVTDGLAKVQDNSVYGFAGSSVAIEYYFQYGDYSDFKTIAHFDEKLALGIGIQKSEPVLTHIMQKIISGISQHEKESIIKKWFSITYENQHNYDLLWKILLAISFIGLFVLYRQFELRRTNIILKKELQKEFESSRDKDRIIFQQNKLAAIGEMIENIAHQWRQPLSQINSAILVVDGLLTHKNIQDEAIEKKLLEIESLTQYMSHTIYDFKDFFSQDKKKEAFNLEKIIKNSLSIIESALKNRSIEVHLHVREEIILLGYPRELQQVILVILNNAKDAHVAHKTVQAHIRISTFQEKESISIEICDNAGGIEPENLIRIFEPYFTTKLESKGTGLGLYMSKMLINESMNGSLNVRNTQDGTCFQIILNEERLAYEIRY
ncbi:MAG: transporter substrate-binding domain-containing protein [Campylobacterota bacterium]|nr:transporter substrate-binding domain-containing protein [Campylobacterota bacterium]